MAKIRRVIRKLKPTGGYDVFDDQSWPIYLALVVLGGFLVGMVLALMPWDAPEWYRKPWLWLATINLSIVGLMLVLRYINNRLARRSLQLAFITSIVVHVLILMITMQIYFPTMIAMISPQANPSLRNRRVTIPEQRPRDDSVQQPERDFERPVEAETPDVEPERVTREKTERETDPQLVQPTPVPQPEETVRPQLERRREPSDVAPRMQAQQSRLSRQASQANPSLTSTPPTPRDAPKPASPGALEAQQSVVQRRTPPSEAQRPTAAQEPTVVTPQPQLQLSRREDAQRPRPETSAAPTLQRQTDTPRETPRTQVAVADTPTVSKSSPQTRLDPSNTTAEKRQTASPDVARITAPPTQESPSQVSQELQRRQLPTQSQPALARAPTSVPNQRSRVTSRPSISPSATTVAPTPNPTIPSESLVARDSSVNRRESANPARRQSNPEPTASAANQPTAVRRDAAEMPDTTPATTPASARTRDRAPQIAANTSAAAPTPAAESPAIVQPAANQIAASKQATANATVNRQIADTPAESPNAFSPAISAEPARRQPVTDSAPSVVQNTTSTPQRRTSPVARPNTAAQVSNPSPAPDVTARAQTVEVEARQSPVSRANSTNQVSRVQRPNVTQEPATAASSNAAMVARRSAAADATPQLADTAATPQRNSSPAAAASSTLAPTPSPAALPTPRTAAQVAARSTAASKQAAASATLAQAEPAALSTNIPDRTNNQASHPLASRQPRAAAAPNLAQSTEAALHRSANALARPSATTLAGEVRAPAAPAQSDNSRPRPSDATVSRQASPTATASRNQPALETHVASAATQFSRPSAQRAEVAQTPSVSGRQAAALPRRAQTAAAAATSPVQVESPALARANDGQGKPTAEPARTALNQALAGVAGVGAARNLQHSPATTNRPSESEIATSVRSALQASASAHRAESTQSNDPGPSLTPSSIAQVQRTQTMAATPNATLQAEAIPTAARGGLEQPSELHASSSAALTQANSNAKSGEITAAKGDAEVDLGPTRLISNADHARQDPSNLEGGGGQPAVNLETQAPKLVRGEVGGAALAAIVAKTTADTVAAPSDEGKSEPLPLNNLEATSIVRADDGASQPISGGPANAAQGPTAEASAADQLARTELSRAEQMETIPGPSRAGGGDPEEEDEEERKQRLAREASGGAPRVALSALAVAETTASPANVRGGGAPPTPAAAVSLSRDSAGGPPLAGGPSADAKLDTLADVGSGPRVSQSMISRAQAAEAAPGNPSSGGGQPDDASLSPVDRQVARSSPGGAPQLAVAGPTIQARVPRPASTPAGGSPPAAVDARAVAAALRRQPESGSLTASAAPATLLEGETGAAAMAGELVASNTIQRAEAAEADQGSPTPGGGSNAPSRSATGPAFVANTQAAVPTAAGSSGIEQAQPVEASASTLARRPGGLELPATTADAGARFGNTPVAADQPAQPGLASAQRRSVADGESGPALPSSPNQGGPLKRGPTVALATGATVSAVAAPPRADGASPAEATAVGDLAAAMGDVSPMSRASSDGAPVNVPEIEGPGGLGDEYTVKVGVNSRRAQTDSLQIHSQQVRFVRNEVGGRPDFSPVAVVAADPFRRRERKGGAAPGGSSSADPKTERAIELGLTYLTRIQLPDGSWSLQAADDRAMLICDTAATALALMAYQGAGYNHKQHKYADVVQRGLDYLLQHQLQSENPKLNGDLFFQQVSSTDDDEDSSGNAAVRLYSHAIATLALCEAYGMTQDPQLKDAAQNAIDFIQNSQHLQRGGWRYTPGQGSDTSVTGWMMMALKSGQLAGLEVRPQTFEKINRWLDKSQASAEQPYLYRYNPYAPDTAKQRHGRVTSKTMTSVGLLMRLYNSWQKDDRAMQDGADYLAENPPSLGTSANPQRDTYYWYYATQVMFHMGGEHWKNWNDRLHPLLVSSQEKQGPLAGSWDPQAPIPDRWAPHAGRLYVTTMNLLSLEVHYRHLPLYEEYGKDTTNNRSSGG